MSKAFGWFRMRGSSKEKSSKEKSDVKKSQDSRFASFTGSERKQPSNWVPDTESPSSKPSQLENPFRGRIQSYGEAQPQKLQHESWNSTSALRPDEHNAQVRESPGRMGKQEAKTGKEFTLSDWKPPAKASHRFVDQQKPGLGKFPSADCAADFSRSSASTDANSFEECEKFSVGRKSVSSDAPEGNSIGSQQSVSWNRRSYVFQSDHPQFSLPKSKEAEQGSFDSLLQNWPKLKATSTDKRRFEARLLTLLETEGEVVVVGEEPTKERWSLGIVDDGMKALGRAVLSRGYPKLKKLSFTNCRMLLESPFATLARAISASNLPNLEEVIFKGNSYISNQGIFELARAFKSSGKFTKLTTLILVDNGMREEGLIAFARDALRSGNLSHLRTLHIGSHNSEKANCEEFRLEGANELAKELSLNGHLPDLDDFRFSGCLVSKGMVTVLEALETRNKGGLKNLDITSSLLELEGVIALSKALTTPAFSYLQCLKLSLRTEELHVLLESFQTTCVSSLQKIVLVDASLGEEELVRLAALLEARHLPALLEFSALCHENTVASALAIVRAYERNNCLVAKLDIDLWPLQELQCEYEKRRNCNLELVELV